MKKLLILATLFVAMASYGGNAHAQSLTPAQAAALQQQLDVAKAQLVQLQMQAGQTAAGDSSLPAGAAGYAGATTAMPAQPAVSAASPTLSASDTASLQATLSALATMLISLQDKTTADPQFATTNGPAVIASLAGVGHTLSIIVGDMNHGGIPAGAPNAQNAPGIAQSNPATVSAPSTAPQSVAAANSAPANTAPANATPQTAQAASAFSFGDLNWPLIVVIILVIAAIAIWLWWDDSEEGAPVVRMVTSTPQRPMPTQQPLAMSNESSMAPARIANVQTPLASAVSPQDSKRKPA